MFDRYASLGNNCEVAFQIRRVLGKDSSGFFSWNVTPLKSLVALLENDFSGILQDGNLRHEPDKALLYDASYQFHVHSSFSRSDITEEAGHREKLEALRSKFHHFVLKFREAGADGSSTAYFLKTEDYGDVRPQIDLVADLLGKMHDGTPFKLIVARPLDRKDDNADGDHVAYRYLKRIAPWADATDGHVQSWDRIFREFPAKDGLRLAGF